MDLLSYCALYGTSDKSTSCLKRHGRALKSTSRLVCATPSAHQTRSEYLLCITRSSLFTDIFCVGFLLMQIITFWCAHPISL